MTKRTTETTYCHKKWQKHRCNKTTKIFFGQLPGSRLHITSHYSTGIAAKTTIMYRDILDGAIQVGWSLFPLFLICSALSCQDPSSLSFENLLMCTIYGFGVWCKPSNLTRSRDVSFCHQSLNFINLLLCENRSITQCDGAIIDQS